MSYASLPSYNNVSSRGSHLENKSFSPTSIRQLVVSPGARFPSGRGATGPPGPSVLDGSTGSPETQIAPDLLGNCPQEKKYFDADFEA